MLRFIQFLNETVHESAIEMIRKYGPGAIGSAIDPDWKKTAGVIPNLYKDAQHEPDKEPDLKLGKEDVAIDTAKQVDPYEGKHSGRKSPKTRLTPHNPNWQRDGWGSN